MLPAPPAGRTAGYGACKISVAAEDPSNCTGRMQSCADLFDTVHSLGHQHRGHLGHCSLVGQLSKGFEDEDGRAFVRDRLDSGPASCRVFMRFPAST